MAAMAKILAWLGGKMVVPEDELEGLTTELKGLGDGNKTLGRRERLAMNDYVERGVVEIIDEVVLNKDEFIDFEGMVEGLGVEAIREANSTDC